MKSRKEKFIEYQDKYGNIPHDYRERLNYMCDKWKDKILNDKFYNPNLSKNYAFRLDRKVEIDD